MTKWIKIREGNYKLVDDSDSRPEVKLPNKKMAAPFIPYSPPWKKYEQDIWNDSTNKSIAATDKFMAEREHETRTDPRAAKWEASRKERHAKDKPAWVKWANREGIR